MSVSRCEQEIVRILLKMGADKQSLLDDMENGEQFSAGMREIIGMLEDTSV